MYMKCSSKGVVLPKALRLGKGPWVVAEGPIFLVFLNEKVTLIGKNPFCTRKLIVEL